MTAQATLALPEGSAAPVTPFDPHSASDPAQIDAWIAEEQRRRLIDFMTIHDLAPLDVLIAAIRQACQRGFGLWMEPPKGKPTLRPATHLVEISLFGVSTVGFALDDAARNWRRAARYIIEQEPQT